MRLGSWYDRQKYDRVQACLTSIECWYLDVKGLTCGSTVNTADSLELNGTDLTKVDVNSWLVHIQEGLVERIQIAVAVLKRSELYTGLARQNLVGTFDCAGIKVVPEALGSGNGDLLVANVSSKTVKEESTFLLVM